MEDTSETQRQSLPMATHEDFNALDWARLLKEEKSADAFAMENVLETELRKHIESDAQSAVRALRVLSVCCGFHLHVDDRANAFGPRFMFTDGRRSLIPSDFRGDQNDVLEQVVQLIQHAGLRARIADVVWYNDRKKWESGQRAVQAYCEIVEKRLDGTYLSRFSAENDTVIDAIDFFHRALQIASMSGKRDGFPDFVVSAFQSLYRCSTKKRQYIAYARIARLGAEYGLIDWDRVAAEAELFAEQASESVPPFVLQPVWDLAADAYRAIKNQEAHVRCVGRSVDQTLRRCHGSNSPAFRAYWTREAIGQLRRIRGARERVEALRRELRDLQDRALDETAQFSVPIDLQDEQLATVEEFRGLTLSDVLLRMSVLTTSPSVVGLRKEAIKSLSGSFWGGMFGSTFLDDEGKVVGEVSASLTSDAPNEEQIKQEVLRILDMRWHVLVGGFIEPARRTVVSRFALEERHLQPIVAASPFVPAGHEHNYALGFARFWQGDYASAVHLLLPQLENSIRHVMLSLDKDSSKIMPSLLQEDRSLSGLVENMRDEMEGIFGPDRTNEIDLLLVHKPGPALRHQVAHGKMGGGDCYQPNSIYACWLAYHLTCIPLLNHWEDIAKEIEQAN